MRVDIPEYNTFVDFPDGTSPDEIGKVMAQNFPSKVSSSTPSFMDRNRANFNARLKNAEKINSNPNMTGIEKTIGNIGQGWGMAADVPMEIIRTGMSAIPESIKNAVIEAPMPFLGGQSLKQTGENLAPVIGAIGQGYNKLEEVAPRVTNPINAVGNAVNLGGLMMGGVGNPKYNAFKVGESPTMGALKEGANISRDVASLAYPKKTISKVKELFAPTPTEAEALGQILQGKTKDLRKGSTALKSINTNNVKTYGDLKTRIEDAVPVYAKKVDDALARDTTVYSLDDLSTQQKITSIKNPTAPVNEPTPILPQKWEAVKHPQNGGYAVIDKSGKYELGQGGHPAFYKSQELAQGRADYINAKAIENLSKPALQGFIEPTTVKVNFVKDALNHLTELYLEIGEKGKAISQKNILKKANTEGLTKKEVNDIARTYNAEFGAKAFGKSGEPLTSVNAQHYENVRSGLKEVARRGLDDTAKETDDVLSSLLNTKTLVSKNMEAANKLQQKYDRRGIGEKLGRSVLTAFDIATAGMVKGAFLKLIPRGLGYKVKNFVELEESLQRNLAILNKGLNEANIPISDFKSATGKKLGNYVSNGIDDVLTPTK